MKPAPGTTITARPWFNGAPLPDACRGIVLAPWAEPADVLVWFPIRGLPTEAGNAVQPILAREIETVTDLADCPQAWLTNAYHRARDSRTLTALPPDVRFDLERAARQRHPTNPARD